MGSQATKAADAKFGTFGGVFTPSLLTILGVIMFLRFSTVVGHAGLWATLAILLAAKSIMVVTGLSISSIATKMKVKGGGAYYLVSRSLGVEFGGVIAVFFYVAQAVAGIGGLRPNTVLLGWSEDPEKTGVFSETLRLAKRMQRSLIVIVPTDEPLAAVRQAMRPSAVLFAGFEPPDDDAARNLTAWLQEIIDLPGEVHEIRNPLHALRLNLHAFRRTQQDAQALGPAEVTRMPEQSSREIDRIDRLLGQLSHFATPDEPRAEAFNLNTELEGIVHFIGQELRRSDVEVQLDLPKSPASVRMDRARLRQIMLNLLHNVRDSMPDGGRIEVRLVRKDARVEILVSDQGRGISAADRPHVFEPLYSTSDDGTGLGLALVKRFVEDKPNEREALARLLKLEQYDVDTHTIVADVDTVITRHLKSETS